MKRSMFEMFQWHKSRYFTGRWEHFCAWRELFVHMPNQGLWCAAWEEVETKVLRHEFRRGSAFIGQTLKSGTTAYLIANLFWDEDLKHVHCVNAETHRSSDKHEQPASLVFVQFATFDGLKDEKTHNHLRLIVLKWISFTLQSSWWRRQMWLPRHYLAEYKFKAEIGAVNRNFTAVKRRNWGQEQIHRLKKRSQPHERHQLEKWKPWEKNITAVIGERSRDQKYQCSALKNGGSWSDVLLTQDSRNHCRCWKQKFITTLTKRDVKLMTDFLRWPILRSKSHQCC